MLLPITEKSLEVKRKLPFCKRAGVPSFGVDKLFKLI
jgi:hypothetical protein